MVTLHAASALLPQGWRADVRISLAGSKIAKVEMGVSAAADDERHAVLIPAIPNLHSHAFQRAMAGLTEQRQAMNGDNFWSWRSAMYKFALAMTPDDVEAVATWLYVEMLESGFSRVGEFHYLHHDCDGRAYSNVTELSERIASAAQASGIGLTLLPAFYAHGSFGGQAPSDGQRRFINSIDGYANIVERVRTLMESLDGGRVGIAPHSLRAVTPAELALLLPMAQGGPIHIHVAEQIKEVEDCISWCGRRPVEFLFDIAPVDDHWCLIHATHLSETEIAGLSSRNPVVGLCPITEANLGDGIIPSAIVTQSSRFGVGSDSNVMLSAASELRQLEYSQRLASSQRNVIISTPRSCARELLDRAVVGGGVALDAPSGIAPGNFADIVSLDCGAVPFLGEDQLLDNWVFVGNIGIDCVWALGRKQVEGGRHKMRKRAAERFTSTMTRLLAS